MSTRNVWNFAQGLTFLADFHSKMSVCEHKQWVESPTPTPRQFQHWTGKTMKSYKISLVFAAVLCAVRVTVVWRSRQDTRRRLDVITRPRDRWPRGLRPTSGLDRIPGRGDGIIVSRLRVPRTVNGCVRTVIGEDRGRRSNVSISTRHCLTRPGITLVLPGYSNVGLFQLRLEAIRRRRRRKSAGWNCGCGFVASTGSRNTVGRGDRYASHRNT